MYTLWPFTPFQPKPLFAKIEPERAEALRLQYAGGQNQQQQQVVCGGSARVWGLVSGMDWVRAFLCMVRSITHCVCDFHMYVTQCRICTYM